MPLLLIDAFVALLTATPGGEKAAYLACRQPIHKAWRRMLSELDEIGPDAFADALVRPDSDGMTRVTPTLTLAHTADADEATTRDHARQLVQHLQEFAEGLPAVVPHLLATTLPELRYERYDCEVRARFVVEAAFSQPVLQFEAGPAT